MKIADEKSAEEGMLELRVHVAMKPIQRKVEPRAVVAADAWPESNSRSHAEYSSQGVRKDSAYREGEWR
ncbi:hypothetical protein TKK_0001000 [Trichogramma kaykai]